jgi:Tfp pilus assembly PilM family ATPase
MLNRTNIGIDFGDYSIKITAFIRKKNKYVNKEYVMNYKISDIENYFSDAREKLKLFKKEFKIKFSFLNFSLPGDIPFCTGLGYADFPSNKSSLMQKALGYEIQKDMGINSLNNYSYLSEEIDTFIDEDNLSHSVVMYNVINKDIIFELKKFTSIKNKIKNVFIQPIYLKNKTEKNSIVVDFGNNKTRLYMFESGVLQNVKLIDFGEKEIDKAIRKSTDFTNKEDIIEVKNKCFSLDEYEEDDYEDISEKYETELEEYKNKYGNDDIEKTEENNVFYGNDELIQECSELVMEEFSTLTQKIKQTVRAYELSNGIKFDNFYISGGLSRYENVENILSDEFSLEVDHLSTLRVFNRFRLKKKNKKFVMSSILTDIEKNENKILNFNKFTKFTVDVIPILIGILCVTVIVNGVALKINKEYNEKIFELNSQLNSVSQEVEREKNKTASIENNIREAEGLASSAKQIDMQKYWHSDVFKVLQAITPSELIIYKMDSKPNVITFNGYSNNYSNIGFFGLALEKYGTVNIKEINKTEANFFITRNGEEVPMEEEFLIVLEYDGKKLKKDIGDIIDEINQ